MTAAGKKLIAAASSALGAIKRMKPDDTRPQRLGWAPGGYFCTCSKCEERFIGDKRAVMCADCAYS
jgi:hypothetical protein